MRRVIPVFRQLWLDTWNTMARPSTGPLRAPVVLHNAASVIWRTPAKRGPVLKASLSSGLIASVTLFNLATNLDPGTHCKKVELRTSTNGPPSAERRLCRSGGFPYVYINSAETKLSRYCSPLRYFDPKETNAMALMFENSYSRN